MNLFVLNTHEPEINLAAEEFVFNSSKESAIMLWQNANAIIVGRNQNTLAEINIEEVRKRNVSVVRRITGGGAVYHDLGNVNYSVITPVANEGDALNFKKFAEPIIELLKSFGVKAEFSGRNDLLIDGKKFSGNAQHVSNGRILHHGTLMFSSDLEAVQTLLKVNPEKIKSKAVSSIRSRVTTISEHLPSNISLDINDFINALTDFYIKKENCRKCEFSDDEIEKIVKLSQEKYRTWDWNYGVSPKYSFEKTTYTTAGTIEIHLDISGGIIKNAAIYGDFFALKPCEEFTCQLIGKPHQENTLSELFSEINITDYFAGVSLTQLLSCFF